MKAAKICLAGVAVVLFFGVLSATDYYVDAKNGNDDWDGTAVAAADVETSKIGPKQALANVMAIERLGMVTAWFGVQFVIW